MEYHIIKKDYINRYGKIDYSIYKIKKGRRSPFGFMIWSYVSCKLDRQYGRFTYLSEWGSLEEAESFIKEYLCNSELVNGVRTTTVLTIKCEK